jgi:Tfp pilus assembly protein PilV
MQVSERGTAWTQGVIVAAFAIAVGVTLLVRLQRPFDRDTLALQVGILQSHAAEAGELARLTRADQLAPGFVGEHAAQLAENVERAQDALAAKDAEPDIEAQRRAAETLGAAVHARLQAWSAAGAQARTRDFGFAALSDQLDALHKQLKPED